MAGPKRQTSPSPDTMTTTKKSKNIAWTGFLGKRGPWSYPDSERFHFDAFDFDQDTTRDDDNAYAKEVYNEALVKLDQQRKRNSYQGADASVLLQHLKCASLAGKDDFARLADEEMGGTRFSDEAMPARALVARSIPDTAPKSLPELAELIQHVYGDSKIMFQPQVKTRSRNEDMHRQVGVNAFVEHFNNPEKTTEIWNLLETASHMFPHAASWIPDWVTQNNHLHDIRARTIGTTRSDNTRSADKLSWYLVGNAGAYSPMHYDGHGYGTFLHVFSSELLLIFSTDLKDPHDRKVVLENMDITSKPTKKIEKSLRKHLRYTVVKPGQLWYMEPGTLHSFYRKEGTLIFGGHFIPKKRLGFWVDAMEEHVIEEGISNETPDDVLLYVRTSLELVVNALRDDRALEYGGHEQVEEFFDRVNDLLTGILLWADEYGDDVFWTPKQVKAWKTEAEALLEKYAGYLPQPSE